MTLAAIRPLDHHLKAADRRYPAGLCPVPCGAGPAQKAAGVLAGPALVWVLSLAAPVSWMVLSKAHAYVHVHLVPMLWHFALVPVSCALLVWLVKTAITAVKE